MLRRSEFEWREIKSPLEGLDGVRSTVRVAISREDGKLRFANFWDLDKTLLFAEPFHFAAVDEIYPDFARDDAAREEFHHFYVAGFTLGNSFREWDRMRRICEEGEDQYRDAKIYEHEFMDNPEKRRLIDEPGHPEGFHERANTILQRYGKIAYRIMEKNHIEDPAGFQRSFTLPRMMRHLRAKSRMGEVNVFMTANQADFAKGLVKFCGLASYGLGLAPDEKMAGGGKEKAIAVLTQELAEMGLLVNSDRAAAIGDSIKGDVGSGTKCGLRHGVLVAETSDDIDAIIKRSIEDTTDGRRINEILRNTKVEMIPYKEVRRGHVYIP